jgi:hypothetical protein
MHQARQPQTQRFYSDTKKAKLKLSLCVGRSDTRQKPAHCVLFLTSLSPVPPRYKREIKKCKRSCQTELILLLRTLYSTLQHYAILFIEKLLHKPLKTYYTLQGEFNIKFAKKKLNIRRKFKHSLQVC